MSDTGSNDPFDPDRPSQPAPGSPPPPPPPPPPYDAPAAPAAPQWGSHPPAAPDQPAPPFGSPGYGAPPAAVPYGATPYGENRQQNLAHWGQRVGAALIDAVVPTVGLFVIVGVAFVVGGDEGNAVSAALAVLGYVAYLAFTIWNVVFRQGRTGQSLGKSALKLYLVRESDGQYVGPGMSFVRQLAHIVDGLPCYVGYLWPLWDEKKQTFADKICSTVVLHRP